MFKTLTLLAAGTLLAVLPAGTAVAYDGYNSYEVVGLPEYITAPTPFTVAVDGNKPVCKMEYDKTVLTTPPWNFTANTTEDSPWMVTVTECDGEEEKAYVRTRVPYRFGGLVAYTDSYPSPGKKQTYRTNVSNETPDPATYTLTDSRGRVVYTQAVGGDESEDGGYLKVEFKPPAKLTKTTTYTQTFTQEGGLTMTSPLILPVGWAIIVDNFKPNCSTLTWWYDKAKQPKASRNIEKDIQPALDVISKNTGLKYVKAAGKEDADLVFSWENMGNGGPSAMGGTDGTVQFNTKDEWPKDRNAGTGYLRGYLPGRVWLIVHEVMHTLGLGHVSDKTQIMNSVGYVNHLGKGDKQGLHALYPKETCSPR